MSAFPWILAAVGWGLALLLLLAIKYGREDVDRRLEDLTERAGVIEERIERLGERTRERGNLFCPRPTTPRPTMNLATVPLPGGPRPAHPFPDKKEAPGDEPGAEEPSK